MAAPVITPVSSDDGTFRDKDGENVLVSDDLTNDKSIKSQSELAGYDLFSKLCEENRQVALHLHTVGCCVRCILRLLGSHSPRSFAGTTQELEKMLLPAECWGSTSDTNTSPCPTCLGILQKYAERDFFLKIVEKVKQASYEFDDHQFSLILPVCLAVREKSVFVNLKRKFGAVYDGKEDKISSVKDVWKWACGPRVASLLDSKFQNRGDFDILLTFTFANSDRECGFLLDVYPDTFRKRKQRMYGYTTFTRAGVAKALTGMDASKFEDCFSCPPSMPDIQCDCAISCSHEPVFIAGRYQKYSRKLCQTPWFVAGERIGESSVQELICEHILTTFKPTEHKLSSSGREDVDVRMLGLGRPFVVELINPHCTRFTPQDIALLQTKINSSTADIQVRDLQIVTRKDTERLKEGEIAKTKTYTAICWCEGELNDTVLKQLDGMKDLTLHQRTPLRVLHRRTAAVRDRVIHNMETKQLSKHRFELKLTTQAGTYIKEFVHGDFGRTTPNLTELLGAECDITGLDVESVDVDWPPFIDPVEKRFPAADVGSKVTPEGGEAVTGLVAEDASPTPASTTCPDPVTHQHNSDSVNLDT